MKQSVIVLFVLIGVFSFTSLAAQETKPVQFSFAASRLNDTLSSILVKAKIEKGTQLFSAKAANATDAFKSSVQFDSAAESFIRTTDSVIETGTLQVIPQPDGSNFRLLKDSVTIQYLLHIPANSTLASIKGSFQWLAKKGEEFPSGEESFTVSVPSTSNVATTTNASPQSGSLWRIFLLTFATGLLAIVTPCVFPLIPVTVSFFLKRSKSRALGIRNAVTYSLSIIAIYTIPTILLTLIFGDKILYHIATSPVSNLLFFAIFMVFATSFFGAFELELPNSWANKADEKAGTGGISGIFFMALTLVIVSFSCTGPIVGTLLGQTSTQGVGIAPVIGMFGFGVGLALPFSLFAFFPTMLHSLPKSGGWLNSVKVTFGFIELALALKFLSNVDLAYHWHLLDRDVFLVLWIVDFALLGCYLLGKLSFSHDSPIPFISVPRLYFAILSFCFSLYMVPGLWGAPLQLLSGFIPPTTTQEFNLDNLKYNIGSSAVSSNNTAAIAPIKYIDKLRAPFGLPAYFDLAEGMAAAKVLHKPVMLDFTGHSCANCRKMEEQVWKDPEVLKRIKEDFVLISLYVDESTELPVQEHYTNAKNEKITTLGEKNLDYETTKFGFNAQPLYMFLDLKGNTLSNIKYGYDADKEKFIQHLDNVKAAFAEQAR